MSCFFFDTANTNFIESTWDKLSNYINPKSVVGVTTNPNAFAKVGATKLEEWFATYKKLASLVAEIRGDNFGEVHIQIPNSQMSPKQVLDYKSAVSDLGGGKVMVGLKIPPFEQILALDFFNVKVNVTGLADHATAAKCLTYGVDYISIIPGRMEEVGIDAKSVINFLNQCRFNQTRIITGSQRTVEQVQWAFEYGTIPTIGERVWKLILEEKNFSVFNQTQKQFGPYFQFSPLIDRKNIDLSLSFFEQMDDLGSIAFADFVN
jgi:transaldolase